MTNRSAGSTRRRWAPTLDTRKQRLNRSDPSGRREREPADDEPSEHLLSLMDVPFQQALPVVEIGLKGPPHRCAVLDLLRRRLASFEAA